MFRSKPIAHQRGVALIVVLMLLAIMVTIAATMSERLFTQFKRSSSQLNYQQAYWYAIGAEALVKKGIEQSYRDSDTVNLSQPWAWKAQSYPLEGGQLTGQVMDKQACFNLNALTALNRADASTDSMRPYLVQVLMHLAEAAGAESYQAEVIADSAWEFIDKDRQINSSNGVEDAFYEGQAIPYLAANHWIADASEFRAVHQVSRDVMLNIAPYICALPSSKWQLNVNTLAPEQSALLVALFYPYLSVTEAKTLLERRPYDGWRTIDDFLAQPELAAVQGKIRQQARLYLSVDSAYFELDAEVNVAESRFRIRSLLHSNNRTTATVISRRFGGISERVFNRSAE